jgi:hypothetical protein
MLGRTVLAIPGPTVTTQEVAGITRDATRESIELLFEGALIKHTSEHLGEGTYVQGTSIYAGTEYELAILWYDDGSIMQVRMLGDYWRTADGIGLGSTLTDLEAVLGTFEIAGFAWDNEGYANLWDTPYEGFFMRLLPPHGEIPPQFMGDSFFQSSQMRNLNPVVVDFRVEFY